MSDVTASPLSGPTKRVVSLRTASIKALMVVNGLFRFRAVVAPSVEVPNYEASPSWEHDDVRLIYSMAALTRAGVALERTLKPDLYEGADPDDVARSATRPTAREGGACAETSQIGRAEPGVAGPSSIATSGRDPFAGHEERLFASIHAPNLYR